MLKISEKIIIIKELSSRWYGLLLFLIFDPVSSSVETEADGVGEHIIIEYSAHAWN